MLCYGNSPNEMTDNLPMEFIEFFTECREVLGEAFVNFTDFLMSVLNGLVSGEELCKYTASHIFPNHPNLQCRLKQFVKSFPLKESVFDSDGTFSTSEESRPDVNGLWSGGPSYRFVPKSHLVNQELTWRAANGIKDKRNRSNPKSLPNEVLNQCFIGTLGLHYEESHPNGPNTASSNTAHNSAGAHHYSTTGASNTPGNHVGPTLQNNSSGSNSNHSAGLHYSITITPGGRTTGASIRASMRKPNALEIMETCEDEQFEVDMKLSRLNYLLTTLHTWSRRMGLTGCKSAANNALLATVSDDCDWSHEAAGVHQCLVIPDLQSLGATHEGAYSLLRVALAEAYPLEDLSELWKTLKRKPQQTIHTMEQRIRTLKESWLNKQRPYKERWTELRKRYSLRALDYQGSTFRSIDTQRLRPKVILHNLRVTHEVKQSQQPTMMCIPDVKLPEELIVPHTFADSDWEFGSSSASWMVLRDTFMIINSALQASSRVDIRNSRRFLNRIKAFILIQISPALTQANGATLSAPLNNSFSPIPNKSAKLPTTKNDSTESMYSPKRRRTATTPSKMNEMFNDTMSSVDLQECEEMDSHVNADITKYYNLCLKERQHEPTFSVFYGSENLYLFFYYFWELYDRLMAFFDASGSSTDDPPMDASSPKLSSSSPLPGGATRRGNYNQAVQQLLLLARGNCDCAQLEERVFAMFPQIAYRWLSMDRILNHILRYLQFLRSQSCTRSLLFALRRHQWQHCLEKGDDTRAGWMVEMKNLDKLAWDCLSGSGEENTKARSLSRGAADRTRAADRDALLVSRGLYRFHWFWPQRRLIMRWFPNECSDVDDNSILSMPLKESVDDINQMPAELSPKKKKTNAEALSNNHDSRPFLLRNLRQGIRGIVQCYYQTRLWHRMHNQSDSSDSSGEPIGDSSVTSTSVDFDDNELPSVLMSPPETSLVWLPIGKRTNAVGVLENVFGCQSQRFQRRQLITKERQLCYFFAKRSSAFQYISRRKVFGDYVIQDDTELHYWSLSRRLVWAKGSGYLFYRVREFPKPFHQHEDLQAQKHYEMELFIRRFDHLFDSDELDEDNNNSDAENNLSSMD